MHYQLIFYVPESHTQKVKDAIFKAGAGASEKYAKACWQTLGTGQFEPLLGSNPHIGTTATLSYVKEYKVEVLCHKNNIHSVIAALKDAHPYEEPAYAVFKLETL